MYTMKGESEYRKGLWTAEEDKALIDYIRVHGKGKWNRIARETGLKRCGKSCRLRWMNYLSPAVKRGDFSEEEDDLIIRLHNLLGNRWSLIAGRVPGRTDNQVKNHWNTHLSKRLGINIINKKNNNNIKNKKNNNNNIIINKEAMNSEQKLLPSELPNTGNVISRDGSPRDVNVMIISDNNINNKNDDNDNDNDNDNNNKNNYNNIDNYNSNNDNESSFWFTSCEDFINPIISSYDHLVVEPLEDHSLDIVWDFG